jgi:CheY-like chemotaxis protein
VLYLYLRQSAVNSSLCRLKRTGQLLVVGFKESGFVQPSPNILLQGRASFHGTIKDERNAQQRYVIPIPTDLVLLDYHMPKANGDVIAERMKASQPDVPIAMLSADEGLRESALESVDVFISKSESPTSLLEMVEHLLDLRFLFASLDDVSGGRQRYSA